MLRALGDRLPEGVGDHRVELGATGPQHLGDADRRRRIGRVAADFAGQGLLGGVGVFGLDPPDRAVRRGQEDGAPVGEARHGEGGQAVEGGLVVERGGQDLASLGQEPDGRLGPFLLGHVREQPERADDFSGGVAHRAGAGQHQQLAAAGAPEAKLEPLGVAGEDAGDAVAGGGDVLRKDKLRHGAANQCLGGGAEHARHPLVGVEGAAGAVGQPNALVGGLDDRPVALFAGPQTGLGGAGFGEEAGVVDRQRRPPRQFLGQRQLVRAVGARCGRPGPG